jgi:two-component system alkaline phosphatase synthesis response regulator PhoP
MKDGKHVILCVDDDADFLDSLQTIVEGEGYIVETANSAEDGLRKYKDVKPDFVLVDLMMEEVDAGTNLVRELKAMGPTPPIVMLSSVGDSLNLSTDYSQLGLDGVLQKPITPKNLLSTLAAKLKS